MANSSSPHAENSIISKEKNRVKYGDRTELFWGDQGDVDVLEGVVEGVGGKNVLDIIIDDGSHDPSDQMVSFEYLFPRLKEGGLYIFEDIETSYWNNNRANLYGNYFGGQNLGVGGAKNVVEKFLKVPNFGKLINGLFVKDNRKKGEEEGRPPHSDMISSVQFCHNMIVVKKMDATDEWVDFKNSPYLFERFTE
jgi:hypothetical protein